jgi:curli biogenesis system outer membrane secretion channel CsgG
MPEKHHPLAIRLPVACLGALLCCSAPSFAGSDGAAPAVDDSRSIQALEGLPPRPLDQRPGVTIYQFRSGVPQITALAATDMFTQALVHSRQFRVVERAQYEHTILPEKQLNGAGQSTGTVAQQQLHGAQYIFEGTVSEESSSQGQHQGGFSIGGLTLGGSRNHDSIAIDVRILDAATGDVLDSVTVRKTLESSSASVSGTAALAGTLAALHGRSANPLTPDVNYQGSSNESVDRALRACINTAVLQLVRTVPAAGSAAVPR